MESVNNEFDGSHSLKRVDRVEARSRGITEFTYNGDDLRTSKTVKRSATNYIPEVTNYLYDRQHVILETGANDALTVRYIRGIPGRCRE